MTWTNAPADLFGLGGLDARPYSGVVICPTPAPHQGTGLPFAGTAARLRAADAFGGAAQPVVARRLQGVDPATRIALRHDVITQNDGTTLGNPSSRRPLS